MDGALCQVAGTVPVIGPPGEAKAAMVPRVVATNVESAGAGAVGLDVGGLDVLVGAVAVLAVVVAVPLRRTAAARGAE